MPTPSKPQRPLFSTPLTGRPPSADSQPEAPAAPETPRRDSAGPLFPGAAGAPLAERTEPSRPEPHAPEPHAPEPSPQQLAPPAQPASDPPPLRPVQTPQPPPSGAPQQDRTLEANAYAISFRLLGDRPAAAAVAGIAAERLRQNGQASSPDWLCHLTLYTLDQTVAPGVPDAAHADEDRFAGLRLALRRRLARATARERVAGALIHLAGYSPAAVADVMGCTETQAAELARVLAPPPGVAYRQLGDPQLTRAEPQPDPLTRPKRSRRPRWTTVVVALAIVAAIVAATQITGPRPTLGPAPGSTAVEEGGAPAQPQRNGGPLTQLTNE